MVLSPWEVIEWIVATLHADVFCVQGGCVSDRYLCIHTLQALPSEWPQYLIHRSFHYSVRPTLCAGVALGVGWAGTDVCLSEGSLVQLVSNSVQPEDHISLGRWLHPSCLYPARTTHTSCICTICNVQTQFPVFVASLVIQITVVLHSNIWCWGGNDVHFLSHGKIDENSHLQLHLQWRWGSCSQSCLYRVGTSLTVPLHPVVQDALILQGLILLPPSLDWDMWCTGMYCQESIWFFFLFLQSREQLRCHQRLHLFLNRQHSLLSLHLTLSLSAFRQNSCTGILAPSGTNWSSQDPLSVQSADISVQVVPCLWWTGGCPNKSSQTQIAVCFPV